jgi:catalase
VQAGALYRVMKEDARQRLVDNIAGSLAQVTKPDVVARAIEHFRKADSEYGERVAAVVKRLRSLRTARVVRLAGRPPRSSWATCRRSASGAAKTP